MAKATLTAVRGMNDILPTEVKYWHFFENAFQDLAHRYGYQEIRTPIVESTNLFVRSIGEATDIVEKETYTFNDRNGDSLTLRPEGTAGVVRAGLEHSLFYNQVQRLWYKGPVFRHERPQKGRYRQFHQIGVEAFGMAGPDIDIELLVLTWRWWQILDLATHVQLEINTLGSFEERAVYRDQLITYFETHKAQLDEDSLRRLYKNPLRILDSKNPSLQSLIENAPRLYEHLSQESKDHFESICRALDKMNIPYRINPRLVRGLDYYCHTVFEWVTTELGAQGTVCAGGRYDGLVAELGGDHVPAVGFAMGVERLLLLLQQKGLMLTETADIYIMSEQGQARLAALTLAEELRTQFKSLSILVHCGEGGLKSQMKRADKSGAAFAFILGEHEITTKQITVKYLRESTEQVTLPPVELNKLIQTYFQES